MKKSFLSVTALFSIGAVVLLLNCNSSFADSDRPKRGEITFGAAEKPYESKVRDLDQFRSVFADVADKVIPSVVSITSTKIDTVVARNPMNQFFGWPFEDFFNVPEHRNMPKPEKKIIPRSGFGSGVIVSKQGHILTNYHVIGEADEIAVELADERKFAAEIIGFDSLSDVAVIKITEEVEDLPVAYLGDSDSLRPGDWVLAVGNPFNLSSTVTSGIVSALGRSTGGAMAYQDFIQTDAAINPGNSGGALVNIDGAVIGINTMIYTRSGGYMGIGFAIPINMAQQIMEDLIFEGKVSRGWLGVQIQDVNQAMVEALKLPDSKGVLIAKVFDGQPAEKAGIKQGDVIVEIDNQPVNNTNELRNTIAGVRPGNTISVELYRGGKLKTIEVKIVERDEDAINSLDEGDSDQSQEPEKKADDVIEKLGMKLGNITRDLREQLNLDRSTTGVVVMELQQASQAAREGLRQMDIIKSVNQKNIKDLGDFKAAISGLSQGDSILLLVERQGSSLFIAFKVR